MTAILYSALKIEPGEARKVFAFALLAALLQAGLAIGTGAADSLFLNGIGPGGLPVVYLLTPAIMLVYVPIYSYLTRRLGIQRLLVLTAAVLAAGGLAMAALLTASRAPSVLFAAKLYTALWFVAQYSVFWNFTDDYFDILDAKRIFPLLTSGSAIGAMTGGLALSILSHRVPTPLLFALWSLLAAAALPLAISIARWYPTAGGAAGEGEEEPRPLEVFRTIGSALRSSRHVRLFVAVGFMSFLTAVVCEFQYMTLFSASRSEAELTALFGRLYVAVNAFNLIVGLLLLNRLVMRLGVPNMALVQPVAFLAVFAFLLVAPGFPAAVAGFFVYQGLMPAVTYDTQNLLLNAAPPAVRAHVRTFVDALAEPGAVAVSGLFLLLGASVLGSERISLTGIGLAAAYIVLVLLMKSGYTAAMVQNLRRGWLDLANAPDHLLTRLSSEELASLANRAAQGEPDDARVALSILWRNDARAAAGALLSFLERAGRDERDAMRTHVARALDEDDPEVVAPLIEWLRGTDPRELGPGLLEELARRGLVTADHARALAHEPSSVDRGAAAIALMQGSMLEDGLQGLEIALDLLASDDGAAAGVRALGFSGHSPYAYSVAPFTRHASGAVRREAFAALGRLVTRDQHVLTADILAVLGELSADERPEAMDVLARIGDPSSIPLLLGLADRFTMRERRRAEASILRFGSSSVPVLVSALRDRGCPFAGRAVAARTLGRLALPQLDLLATPLIRDEIDFAYRAIWRWSRLDQSDSAGPGLQTLKQYYLDVRRDVVEFVLQILAVGGRLPNFELLSASLGSDHRKERADAIETIEQGVDRGVFRDLLPLIDQRSPAAQTAYCERRYAPAAMTLMQVLEAALEGTRLERMLAAQALCDAGPEGIAVLRPRLDRLDRQSSHEVFPAMTHGTGDGDTFTRVEKIHTLRRSPLFSRLGIQDAHVLAGAASATRAPEGLTIFTRGDPADAVFCVIEGSVELSRDGRTAMRSAGDVFGEEALGSELRRGEDAASRGARLLAVPAASIVAAARNHPRIAMALFRIALDARQD